MLSKRSDVQMLFLVDGEVGPALDKAVPTDRVPSVWSRGMNGADRTIAIVEEANVKSDSGYLNVVGSTPGTNC
jgi:hypothetical protein